MNITVVGGGNVGTLIAGEFTRKGHKVTIYTRDKSRWSNEITVFDKDIDEEYKYVPYLITENIEEAVSDAEVIFITLPPFASKNFVLQSQKYIKPKTWVGFYPGTGGIEFISSELIKKGCIIFGTQRICSVVRLKKYGEYVVTSGKRKELFLGTIPEDKSEMVSKVVSDLLDIKINPLPNYLNVTLTPSNPILHPTRLYSIFKDYKEGVGYKEIPLFYEDWTDEASYYLISCDNELHQILDKINVDSSYIIPLLDHYESYDSESLTRKIKSIKSFKGITSPCISVDDGFIPDLGNRYFTSDFPYGLVIIKAFALVCDVDTPNIDTIISWYQNLIKKEYINISENKLGKDSKELSLPQLFGINSISDIGEYYTKEK